jgi:hypothetical protein
VAPRIARADTPSASLRAWCFTFTARSARASHVSAAPPCRERAAGAAPGAQVVQFALEAVRAEAFNPGTLFLFGCYMIGKERLFLEVARALQRKARHLARPPPLRADAAPPCCREKVEHQPHITGA